MDNPYQPPGQRNPGQSAKPDLAYWVHGYIGLRVCGLLSAALLFWYAKHTMPAVPSLGWQMWAMLAWILFGTLAAVGVAFRIRLSKHLLVLQLVCSAAVELYAFNAMMGLERTPSTEPAVQFGWAYFSMAVWDLLWAALFQFSRGLRNAMRV